MHFNVASLGNVFVLPTRRSVRRLQNRFYLLPLTRRVLLVFVILLLTWVALWWVRDVSRSRAGSRSLEATALAPCLQAPVEALFSFDPYMSTQKERGKRENDFENRFQEDVWDTLQGIDLFPAWSDMRWNIPQYARALATDLAIVQAISSTFVGDPAPSIPSTDTLVPYGSSRAAVQLHYVHHRLDRLRGLQYAVHFSPRQQDRENRSFTALVEKSLDSSQCRVSMVRSSVTETIYFLLPYKNRKERLRIFMANFLFLRENKSEQVVLIISILRGETEDERTVYAIRDEVMGRHSPHAKSVWVHTNDGDSAHDFSRGVALRESAKLVNGGNAVLFHCDVDMLVLPGFLTRCRRNSVLGSQVYYPIFYSLYPYANARPAVVERNGFWRKSSFGMTCIRKGDFEDVGAFKDAETRFHGWGSEDVFQFELIRNTSSLVAFRAVEPGLMHRWHSKNCNVSSEAYVDCMKTNFATMGHPLKIGPTLLDSLKDVNRFFHKLEIA